MGTLSRRLKTPGSLIAHDIQFFNRRLRKEQYFFSDIKDEGILLYDSGKFELAEARTLSSSERQHLAEEDFEYWFTNGVEFADFLNDATQKERLNKAAFFLHQATECFYSTILLVFTRYKPNTHDLKNGLNAWPRLNPSF